MQFPDRERYEFTEEGTIFDLQTRKWRKPAKMRNGYYNIKLISEDGSSKTWLVSTITWWWFHNELIDRQHFIKHLDGDTSNNRISNLQKLNRLELGCINGFCGNYTQLTCPKCGCSARISPKMLYHMKHCDGTMTNNWKYKHKLHKKYQKANELSSNHL